MNKLLIDKIEQLLLIPSSSSYTESVQDNNTNNNISILTTTEMLLHGTQYQINKILIQKLKQLKAMIIKQRKQKHNLLISVQRLEVEKIQLENKLKYQIQTMKQIQSIQHKRYQGLINELRSIGRGEEQDEGDEDIELDQILGRLKRRVERGKRMNEKKQEGRSERLRKEVSNIILQNFKTTRLLLKTDNYVNEHFNIKNQQKQNLITIPPSNNSPPLNNKTTFKKQKSLTVNLTLNQYIIPNKNISSSFNIISRQQKQSFTLDDNKYKEQQQQKQKDELYILKSNSDRNINKIIRELEEERQKYKILKQRYDDKQEINSVKDLKILTLDETALFLRDQLKKNDHNIYGLKDSVSNKDNIIVQMKVEIESINKSVQRVTAEKQLLKREIQSYIDSGKQLKQKNEEIIRRSQENKVDYDKKQGQDKKKLLESQSKILELQKSIKFLLDKMLQNKNEKDKLVKQITQYQKINKELIIEIQKQRKSQIIQNHHYQQIKQENQKLRSQIKGQGSTIKNLLQKNIDMQKSLSFQKEQFQIILKEKQQLIKEKQRLEEYTNKYTINNVQKQQSLLKQSEKQKDEKILISNNTVQEQKFSYPHQYQPQQQSKQTIIQKEQRLRRENITVQSNLIVEQSQPLVISSFEQNGFSHNNEGGATNILNGKNQTANLQEDVVRNVYEESVRKIQQEIEKTKQDQKEIQKQGFIQEVSVHSDEIPIQYEQQQAIGKLIQGQQQMHGKTKQQQQSLQIQQKQQIKGNNQDPEKQLSQLQNTPNVQQQTSMIKNQQQFKFPSKQQQQIIVPQAVPIQLIPESQSFLPATNHNHTQHLDQNIRKTQIFESSSHKKDSKSLLMNLMQGMFNQKAS